MLQFDPALDVGELLGCAFLEIKSVVIVLADAVLKLPIIAALVVELHTS